MRLFLFLVFPKRGDISPTLHLVPDDDRPIVSGGSQVLSVRAPSDHVHRARVSFKGGGVDGSRRMRSDFQPGRRVDVRADRHIGMDGPDLAWAR